MLVIAANSPNLAHQHWEDKKTAKRPNNFDWDCCITDLQAWMVANRLKINDRKMEFLFVGSRQQLSKVQLELIIVEDSEISIRNLGAYFMAFMWAKSAVRPCAIYILSDWSENICRKMLQSPGSRVCNISSWLLQLPALWFPKYQRGPLQRILSSCNCPHCLLGTQVQSPHTSLYNLHWLSVP